MERTVHVIVMGATSFFQTTTVMPTIWRTKHQPRWMDGATDNSGQFASGAACAICVAALHMPVSINVPLATPAWVAIVDDVEDHTQPTSLASSSQLERCQLNGPCLQIVRYSCTPNLSTNTCRCSLSLKFTPCVCPGNHQRRITFKDSINYFFCELDALVKSFDLPADLATVKPFFPYLYIQRQHLHQRLAGLPPMEFYAPDTMKADKREKFLRWYETNNNAFQLREQLIMYCTNDVAILRESVIRFRQLIGEHTQGLDPFTNASTAAGLALSTLRRCFLPANRLVHSPEGGYLRGGEPPPNHSATFGSLNWRTRVRKCRLGISRGWSLGPGTTSSPTCD
uniref:DNA-directed DNA polymerase n=1 Tax=Globodera pallida TaxID=36090 RepID=A0A183CDA7_GLOPA